jgi:hypothetical protein
VPGVLEDRRLFDATVSGIESISGTGRRRPDIPFPRQARTCRSRKAERVELALSMSTRLAAVLRAATISRTGRYLICTVARQTAGVRRYAVRRAKRRTSDAPTFSHRSRPPAGRTCLRQDNYGGCGGNPEHSLSETATETVAVWSVGRNGPRVRRRRTAFSGLPGRIVSHRARRCRRMTYGEPSGRLRSPRLQHESYSPLRPDESRQSAGKDNRGVPAPDRGHRSGDTRHPVYGLPIESSLTDEDG